VSVTHQTQSSIGCSVPTSVAFMSVPCTTSSSVRPLYTVRDDVSCHEARPILRPPKKRQINLASADDVVCHEKVFCGVTAAFAKADLTEWKGQRVLAQNATDYVYRPGLVRSISTSDSPIGIQFDGQTEIVLMSLDTVISDNAPPSAVVSVGMRVCVRTSSELVEYHLGVVRERLLQPPVTRFLVELDGREGSSIWVSRASLRLLQVIV